MKSDYLININFTINETNSYYILNHFPTINYYSLLHVSISVFLLKVYAFSISLFFFKVQ
jgi:hypothetical protein